MEALNQALDVWGDLACFSRPEMKVERFSYPIITPSAARGIFDAIYCKPVEFRWQVTRIEVVTPPSYIALRRNEVKEKAPVRAVEKWASGSTAPEPILADADKSITGNDKKGRTQRQTMALKNVRYRIHAHVVPWPGHEQRLQALESQFRRRAASGKCIYQPYLGCREFPAFFELVDVAEDPVANPSVNIRDLGWVLYDVFDLSSPQTAEARPFISLFKPTILEGVMQVPPYHSTEVAKPEQGGV
jgi:CRISPR-associated protein Cas5d